MLSLSTIQFDDNSKFIEEHTLIHTEDVTARNTAYLQILKHVIYAQKRANIARQNQQETRYDAIKFCEEVLIVKWMFEAEEKKSTTHQTQLTAMRNKKWKISTSKGYKIRSCSALTNVVIK